MVATARGALAQGLSIAKHADDDVAAARANRGYGGDR